MGHNPFDRRRYFRRWDGDVCRRHCAVEYLGLNGGVGAGLSLFHGPQERRRCLGRKNARRLARQPEKVGPWKPHAISRPEKGRAPRGRHRLP